MHTSIRDLYALTERLAPEVEVADDSCRLAESVGNRGWIANATQAWERQWDALHDVDDRIIDAPVTDWRDVELKCRVFTSRSNEACPYHHYAVRIMRNVSELLRSKQAASKRHGKGRRKRR